MNPPITIPKDILSRPNVVAACQRLKLSGEGSAYLVAVIIKECGGNIDDYSLNASNTNRQRKRVAGEMAAEKKEKWQPPDFPVLQWDEKRMQQHGETKIRLNKSDRDQTLDTFWQTACKLVSE